MICCVLAIIQQVRGAKQEAESGGELVVTGGGDAAVRLWDLRCCESAASDFPWTGAKKLPSQPSPVEAFWGSCRMSVSQTSKGKELRSSV